MPSMRTTAVVVTLVALAGCNGFLPGPSPPDTPEPTETTSSEPQTYPPGVSDQSVEDPQALRTANAQAIANTTAETTWTRRVSYANGSVAFETRWTVTTWADDRGYALDGWTRGSPVGSPTSRSVNLSQWSNGSVTAVRTVQTDDTRYDYADERRELPVDRFDGLYESLVSLDTRTTGVTGDEATRIHVVGTEFEADGGLTARYANESLESFEMEVAPNGTVTSFRLVYTATAGDHRVTVTTEYDAALGEDESPSPPSWVETARTEAGDGDGE